MKSKGKVSVCVQRNGCSYYVTDNFLPNALSCLLISYCNFYSCWQSRRGQQWSKYTIVRFMWFWIYAHKHNCNNTQEIPNVLHRNLLVTVRAGHLGWYSTNLYWSNQGHSLFADEYSCSALFPCQERFSFPIQTNAFTDTSYLLCGYSFPSLFLFFFFLLLLNIPAYMHYT